MSPLQLKLHTLCVSFVILLGTLYLASAESNFEQRKYSYDLIMKDFAIFNNVDLRYSDELGFYIYSKRDLKPNESLFRIPYDSILMPFNPFPYKKTLLTVLTELNTGKGVLSPGVKLFEMATAVMMYIERNLKENKFSNIQMYRDKSELNRAFLYSFPEFLPHMKNWDEETYQFYRNVSYTNSPRVSSFGEFYKKFINKLKAIAKGEEQKELLELFNNQKELELCLDLVITRAFFIDTEKLQILSKNQEGFDPDEVKFNAKFFKSYTTAMLPGAEIVNHRFAKPEDEGKTYGFDFKFAPGYLEYKSVKDFPVGEEVSVTYQKNAANAYTLEHYGVAGLDNYDNSVSFFIGNNDHLFPKSPAKKGLCDQLGWYKAFNGQQFTYVVNRRESFSKNWIDINRVALTSDRMARSKWVSSNLSNNGYISLYNEWGAIMSLVQMFDMILPMKTSRNQDEKQYKEVMDMLERKDFTKYNEIQLFNRMTILIAGIDEKKMFMEKLIYLYARMESLIYQTILAETE